MKPGKAAVKAEKKEMKASVKAMTPPAKSKPGVSPNPLVTGGMARSVPKAGGLVGGAGTAVKKMAPGPQKNSLAAMSALAAAKRSMTPTPGRAGIGTVASKMGAAPKVQPKPVIRSTAKPAMPSRKK